MVLRRRFRVKRRKRSFKRAYRRQRRTFRRRKGFRKRTSSDYRRPYGRDHQFLKITIEEQDIPSQNNISTYYLPQTNHSVISVTTNQLNNQLQDTLADRWQMYKVVKAVTRFRLVGVKGNSNYVPAEQYSGSYIYPDHELLPASLAEIGEILQCPFGRKHGMYGGVRTWYPKLLHFVSCVGDPANTQSKYTTGQYVSTSSSGDTGNIQWGGLGLILPGVHTTPVPYVSSDATYYVPKWIVDTTYYVRLQAQKNYYGDIGTFKTESKMNHHELK